VRLSGDAHGEHGHAPNRYAVLTAAERLNADTALAGRGVTIAFLDSGFFPHPDLTQPGNRILAVHDSSTGADRLDEEPFLQPSDWHGTQTSVVACGNGHLSGGLYRGLAHESHVVLVKVGESGRIREEHIAAGLEWVLAHRDRYAIRVVSISLGGDEDAPLADNRVNMLAEEAVRRGLILVVASGNAGCTPMFRPVPPATSPSVITVGGYDDGNDPDGKQLALYCSSFGTTADGLAKPELIAPARGVAAPILPGTPAYRRAEALSRVAAQPDILLATTLRELALADSDLLRLQGATPAETRARIEEALRAEKVVAAHYQHVDGTSFAAPIVASVVAQMLEANPALTPAAVKHLLVTTADRVSGVAVVRQGHGMLCARRAVEAARREVHGADGVAFAGPRLENGRVVFTYHDDRARRVELVAEFNDWDPRRGAFDPASGGVWRLALDAPPPGSYRYKLLVNGERWIEDPANGAKEPDPYGGFDSVLRIEP
jgi:serine protease AprX